MGMGRVSDRNFAALDTGGVSLVGAPVVVMDAECALCTRGARFIHRMDRTRTVRIAPLQGETGARLMAALGGDPLDPDSWLLIEEDGAVWCDMEAVIRLGRRLGGWGHVLRVLVALPKPLRGWLYRRIARNRYALFGRADMCALPDPEFRARLLP